MVTLSTTTNLPTVSTATTITLTGNARIPAQSHHPLHTCSCHVWTISHHSRRNAGIKPADLQGHPTPTVHHRQWQRRNAGRRGRRDSSQRQRQKQGQGQGQTATRTDPQILANLQTIILHHPLTSRRRNHHHRRYRKPPLIHLEQEQAPLVPSRLARTQHLLSIHLRRHKHTRLRLLGRS